MLNSDIHTECVKRLDDTGCHWGQKTCALINQTISDELKSCQILWDAHNSKQLSDIGDAMQVARSSLQILQEYRKDQVIQTRIDVDVAEKRESKASERFDSLVEKFDSLWWKILIASIAGNALLFGVLLSLFLNHIGQSKP